MIEIAEDFEDLVPAAKQTPPSAAIAFATIALRGGVERVSLSFSAAAIARLEGWPRFAVAYSPTSRTFRIRADRAGRFEAFKTVKGERYVLRVELPAGVALVPKLREPAPYTYAEDGRTVYVRVPPAFVPKPAALLPAPAARPALPPSGSHRALVEAAARAVPARKYT